MNFEFPELSLKYIHVMLVHFPIAFIFLIFLLALAISFFKKENWIEILGYLYALYLASIVFSVWAGFYGLQVLLGTSLNDMNWVSQNQEFMEMLYFHRNLGVTIAFLSFFNWFFIFKWKSGKRQLSKISFLTLSLILVILVTLNAHLGANLKI